MTAVPSKTVYIFCSYSHKDEKFREQLGIHLALLKRQGVINEWHDRKISPGEEWKSQIDEHLEIANIILLLISPDFIASDYYYDVEMKRALEKHDAGQVCVIPIILRPVDWTKAPFAKLQVLPRDGRPVIDWPNRDAVWKNVVQSIREVVEKFIIDSSDFTNKDQAELNLIKAPLANRQQPSDSGKASGLIFANITLDSDSQYWYESKDAIIHTPGDAQNRDNGDLRYFLQDWGSRHPQMRKYPFNDHCEQKFYLSRFVLDADPCFDVTLLNTGNKPLILTEIGIEVVKACHLTYAYGHPQAVKIKATDSYIVDMSSLSTMLWETIKNERATNKNLYKTQFLGLGLYTDGPAIGLSQMVNAKIPDPIYLPANAPYRYKLTLQNYQMPNNTIIKMRIRTTKGEECSHSIFLFTL